jgi:DNA-binding transcriptional MerR regulator
MPASTLDYWVQIGLVRPTLRRSQGRRVERWWSVNDLVVVRVVRALRQAGASLQQVRRVSRQLAAAGDSLSSCRLFWDGRDVLLLEPDGEITSVLNRPGQGMLQIVQLPVSDWHREAAAVAVPVDLTVFRRDALKRRRAQVDRTEPVQSLLADKPQTTPHIRRGGRS